MGAEFHGMDREDNQYVRVTRVVEAEGQVGAVGVCACARMPPGPAAAAGTAAPWALCPG